MVRLWALFAYYALYIIIFDTISQQNNYDSQIQRRFPGRRADLTVTWVTRLSIRMWDKCKSSFPDKDAISFEI